MYRIEANRNLECVVIVNATVVSRQSLLQIELHCTIAYYSALSCVPRFAYFCSGSPRRVLVLHSSSIY